jgi:hypothetical protein
MALERFLVSRAPREHAQSVSVAGGTPEMPAKSRQKSPTKKYAEIKGITGWGARIRTWEWRNQNPPISLEHSALILKKLRNSASCPVKGLAFFSEWVPVGAVMFANAGIAQRP